jgi:integrase
MREWFTAAIRLLEIPEKGPEGHKARTQILALIRKSREENSALPSADDLRRRHAVGAAFEPGSTGEFLLAWLAEHEKAGHWSATTLLSYRSRIDELFLPAFGKVPLDRLRKKHILDMFDEVDKESARVIAAKASPDPEVRKSVAGRRPTGPATKARILAVIRSALSDAASQEKRLVAENVAMGIRFGKQRRGKGRGSARTVRPRLWTAEREEKWRSDFERRSRGMSASQRFQAWRSTAARPGPVMVWRPEHVGRFLDAAVEHRMYPLFCLIAYLALRRGEALGLKWAETDLDARSVMIGENTIVQVGYKPVEQAEAKTEESVDWVRVDDEVIVPLRACRRRQAAERLAWGPAWRDAGYCFTWPDGSPYHPAQATRQFERLAFGAGLPPVTLRDVRHCAPTIALAAGKDIKVVSAMMRHASVEITADVYALVLPELAAEVSSAVAASIPRAVRAAD